MLRKVAARARGALDFCVDSFAGKMPGNSYYAWRAQFCRDNINAAIKEGLDSAIFASLDTFSQLQARHSDSATPIPPDFIDIINLISLVRFFESKSLIEYGSGCSTAGFFRLVAKSSGIRFESFESSDYWYRVNSRALDSMFGACGNASLICAPSNLVSWGGVTSYVHSVRPSLNSPDFIYVDGPPLIETDNSLDILYYDLASDQTVVAIDGRLANADILFKLLKKNDRSWRRFAFNYPSNDTLIISEKNRKFGDFLGSFGGRVGCYG